jgi:riboflavin synthase
VFTGIVEELGRLTGRSGSGRSVERFVFDAPVVTASCAVGDSIAVNGCCLTVVDLADRWWAADVVGETLATTTLAALAPGDPVNLERALRLADRLGGHLVQGHVDGVGEVSSAAPDLSVRVPGSLMPYLVAKGSVTVDGCSLTVLEALADSFSVAVIPHTAEVTTLGRRRPGDGVNLEVDMIAKYVERLLRGWARSPCTERASAKEPATRGVVIEPARGEG